MIELKVKCINNSHGNGNFTVGKEYEVKGKRITCDFVHILLKNELEVKDNKFEFAFCEFEVSQ